MIFKRAGFFFLLIAVINLNSGCDKKPMEIIHVPVEVRSAADIHLVTDSLVIPYKYTGQIILDSLTVDERKEKFIALLLPAVLASKFKLELHYNQYISIIEKDPSKWGKKERLFIKNLQVKYKTTDTLQLKRRLMSHPVSIVLAQAAVESAWGTSRFFKEANNPFGIWSFSEDEPRISSLSSRDGENVYLRKYNSIEESLDDYFKIIARGPYSQFRKARFKSKDPENLIPALANYSEKKTMYTQQLSDILKQNDLTRYDHYIIDPDYIND